MTPTVMPEFPLVRSIYGRAVHILNGLNVTSRLPAIYALRQAMDVLIDSEYAKDLENFSEEFAERLLQGEAWELRHVPEWMRDADGNLYITEDDARSLLENWPDPTRLPDGYPDQRISDIEAVEELLYQRRKNNGDNNPTEAQCYALIALEKIDLIESIFPTVYPPRTLKYPPVADVLHASEAAIEAMEMICTAERKRLIEQLPANTVEKIREIEVEIFGAVKRALAQTGAKNRWQNDPKTLAKQQVKECWDLWQANPSRYRGKAEFARDMLSKFEDLNNHETIQRWCRVWQADAASIVTTQPAQS